MSHNRDFVTRRFLPCKLNGNSTIAILATGSPATFISKMLMEKLGLGYKLNMSVTGNSYGPVGELIPIIGVLKAVPVEFTPESVVVMKIYVFENDHYDAVVLGNDLFSCVEQFTTYNTRNGIKKVGFRINGAKHSVICLRYKDQVPQFAESIPFSPIHRLEVNK